MINVVFRGLTPRELGAAQCRRIPFVSTLTGFTWNATHPILTGYLLPPKNFFHMFYNNIAELFDDRIHV